jgi:hypothetical protein
VTLTACSGSGSASFQVGDPTPVITQVNPNNWLAGAASGKIMVSAQGVCGQADFALGNPDPRITGLSPDNGSSGSEVVVTGANFGNYEQGDAVKFSGAEAPIVEVGGVKQWSDTQIVVTVPEGLGPGSYPVIVERADGQRSNGVGFLIPFPASFDSIRITPESFSMVVGDTRQVTVIDNYGRPGNPRCRHFFGRAGDVPARERPGRVCHFRLLQRLRRSNDYFFPGARFEPERCDLYERR